MKVKFYAFIRSLFSCHHIDDFMLFVALLFIAGMLHQNKLLSDKLQELRVEQSMHIDSLRSEAERYNKLASSRLERIESMEHALQGMGKELEKHNLYIKQLVNQIQNCTRKGGK